VARVSTCSATPPAIAPIETPTLLTDRRYAQARTRSPEGTTPAISVARAASVADSATSTRTAATSSPTNPPTNAYPQISTPCRHMKTIVVFRGPRMSAA
jgi:hypothetical protein